MYIALELAMFCFCCINCHAVHSSLLQQLECLHRWTTFVHHVLSTSPTHLPFLCLWTCGSLVIYSCHSRGSAPLVMLLPYFFDSVCAQTDLFPDFTLFLSSPPLCSFPLPKILLLFIASIESGNHCSAKIHFCNYCSVFHVSCLIVSHISSMQ